MSIMSAIGDDSPSLDGTPQNKASGLHAPKNKQCPFCGEPFTSSSLGRHLDLYIKEKNAKAPDGIHDVDRIREIRGTITRRQPKRTTKASASPKNDARVERRASGSAPQHVGSPYGHQGAESGTRWTMNKPTWEATGVITDIPSTPDLDLDAIQRNRDNINKSNAARQARILQAGKIRARAAELALQELLDSVNAAMTQANPSEPFEFDFLSQTFPALCLKLLSRQPTLHSAQVIENPKYCPIRPPGEEQYNVVLEILKTKLDEFTLLLRAKHKHGSETSTMLEAEDERLVAASIDVGQYIAHLDRAWEVWSSTSEAQKASLWHLEVLRALSYHQDQQKQLSDALAKSQAEQEHLRMQIERLNECQQPKEFTFQIPTNWHISKEAASALLSRQTEAPPARDVLVEKWTNIIKKDFKYQRASPAPIDTGDHDSMDIDGQARRYEDEEEESEDAAGEDEDINASINGY